MTHKMKQPRWITVQWILVIAIVMLLQCDTVIAQNKQIRVGFPALEGLQELSSYGEYYGYNYEYLQEIAREENWNISFVVDSWPNCIEMLMNGELDVMGFLTRTGELEQKLDFADLEAGVCSTTIFADEDNTNFTYGEYTGLHGRRIGILSGNEMEGDLDIFLTQQDVQMEKVYYETQALLDDALSDGSIDTMLGTNFRYTDNKKLVAQFTPRRFYFATTKGNIDILADINHAMEQITIMYPMYNLGLYNTFYGEEYSKVLSLTNDEKNYIKNLPPLRVIYDPNNQPVEYTDRSTGEFSGAMKSIYDDISQFTGLEFEFQPVNTYQKMVEMIMNDEADIICSFERNAQWEQDLNINTTYTLFSQTIQSVYKEDAKKDGTLGLIKRYTPVQTRKEYESNHNVTYYESVEACLQAVRDNKVSEVYVNQQGFTQYKDNYAYRELLSGNTISKIQLGIGVSAQNNHMLYAILNKAVVSLDTNTINDYIIRASADAKPITLVRWIMVNSGMTIIIVLVAILGVTCNLFYMRRERKKYNRLLSFNQRTNIWNESKFLKEAAHALRTNPSSIYVFVVTDIARFRFVNDAFGYQTGDRILLLFAQAVKRMMMYDGEFYGSIGADHFVALMKYESEDVMRLRFKTMLNDFQQEVFTICDFRFVVRSGCVVIDGENRNKDIYEIFQNANHARAMIMNPYRSEYRFYDEALAQSIESLRVMDKDMMRAFRDQNFVPYFQLKYNIFTDEIVGAEALVRWNHPEQGVLPPSEFLPYFERSGFIVDVDFYILEKTCEMLADWKRRSIPLFPISCNFSRLHFTDDMFAYHIQKITEKYQIPNEWIEVEITETVAMENLEQIIEQIRSLKLMRFRISIDDFGSGYSSLGVLQMLDVDEIKLDRSFLSEQVSGKRNETILKGIITLASKLGIHVICEGVETLEQVELLKQIHCNEAQGFYYAKPVTPEELEKRVIKELTHDVVRNSQPDWETIGNNKSNKMKEKELEEE